MQPFLIDTNVLSEIQKPNPNQGVKQWFDRAAEDSLFVSVVSLGEIRAGIAKIIPTKPALAADLEQWLTALARQFHRRILPVSEEIADCWGWLIANNKQHVIDALLVATAKVHGLTLVTRNVKHMQHDKVSLLNPFT